MNTPADPGARAAAGSAPGARPRALHWRFPGLSLLLLVLALAAIAAGMIPGERALAVLERVWPVLLFLLLLKVVSDLLEVTGLFAALSALLARAGRGHPAALLGLVTALGLVCTIVLSLDATAVLVTPIAIGLARREGLRIAPFLLACIWSAGVGSLLLPVSNLTNLLAQQTLSWHALEFARATWPLQIVLALVLVAVLLALFGGRLREARVATGADGPVGPAHGGPAQRAADGEPQPGAVPAGASAGGDRGTGAAAWAGALGIAGFAAAVLAGVEPWLAAAALSALLLVAALAAAPRGGRGTVVRAVKPPWAMAAFALGLFLLMEGISAPLQPTLQAMLGPGEGFAGLLRVEAVAALAANLGNNLPAYLLLEPAAGSPGQVLALLVGVNAGALVLPWGSLSTLLVLQVARERGAGLSMLRIVGLGALLVVLLLVAGAAVLGA
ncbi:hypothetical protein Bequi_07355 [Brachybacterium sp. JHP9]|uniref:Citrate transporter-like domain-containing protein n=1 Tax=Brachybacterium equifaecis TaxID=2910770 RepID=A0ABT0QZY9_9MICO|nr:hypothetical protein [Brachybacterium equifaecis]